MSQPIYKEIASRLHAIANCERMGNTEWKDKHYEYIDSLMSQYAPSGSGFDSGTILNMDKTIPDKLVFNTDYHHMHSNGYYCGWTLHQVTVRPSLAFGIELSISGKDKNNIKDLIYDVFYAFLTTEV